MDIENKPTKLTESADLANSAVSMTIILNECINYASWQKSEHLEVTDAFTNFNYFV